MGWVRLDDRITENPKLDEVGPTGSWLYVSAIAFCNRNLTDGFFPERMVYRLGSFDWDEPDVAHLPRALVRLGLWHDADSVCSSCPEVPDGQLYIHDYGEYQPTKAEVEARRKADAERQRRHRENADRDEDGRFMSRRDSRVVSRRESHSEGDSSDVLEPVSRRDKHRESRRDNNVTNAVTKPDQGKRPMSRRDTDVTNAVSNAVSHAVPNPTQERDTDRDKSLSADVVDHPRRVREPDDLWETVLMVCRIPDDEPIPKSARGAYNKAVSEIRKAGGTPEDVMERAIAFRNAWPGVSLTPTALARRWSEVLGVATQPATSRSAMTLAAFAAGGGS